MKNLYIHFLSLTRSRSLPSLFGIDYTALLLLNEIAVQQYIDKPLTVTEAMNLEHLGSPATLHRKLDDLRDARLVNSIYVEGNRRSKLIGTTKLANDYFDKMSNAMQKVVSSTH